MPQAPQSPERFWARVDKSGACWLWTGARSRSGYGLTSRNGRSMRAHRLAIEYTSGPIPHGLSVLHRCDNPPCVNPAHLYVGTDKDNNRDRLVRRGYQISKHKKIPASTAKAIAARMRQGGIRQTEIAREHGISPAAVWLIVNAINWEA